MSAPEAALALTFAPLPSAVKPPSPLPIHELVEDVNMLEDDEFRSELKWREDIMNERKKERQKESENNKTKMVPEKSSFQQRTQKKIFFKSTS